MEAFLISTGIVALAEMGDKTQLLALILATRFRRPVPIIAAILLATIVNHGIAGALGAWLTAVVNPRVLRWVLGLSFVGMALWMLIPDTIDADAAAQPRYGVFVATLIAFFLAEMGDKTQLATIALAAQYASFVLVVLGTTFGMMLANVPAVIIGERLAGRLPLRLIHAVAAAIFAILGLLAIFNAGHDSDPAAAAIDRLDLRRARIEHALPVTDINPAIELPSPPYRRGTLRM